MVVTNFRFDLKRAVVYVLLDRKHIEDWKSIQHPHLEIVLLMKKK